MIFHAVDGPLNGMYLEFAQRQSARAEVSPWSLSAEYRYSSLRGDVDRLFRRRCRVDRTGSEFAVEPRKIDLSVPWSVENR